MSDSKISFTIALLVHLMLLLLFATMKFNIKPIVEYENIEIVPIDDLVLPKPENNKVNTNSSQGDLSSAGKSSAPSIRISLPSTAENSDDIIRMNQLPVKKDKNTNTTYNKTDIDDSWGKSTTMREAPSTSVKINSNSQLTGNNSNLSNKNNTGGQNSDGSSSFEMQGDVINRQVLKKVLPKYPEDLAKNGTVMLKFSVMANGSVSEITIVKKSDPVFENISINALSQWRFNMSDKKNTGIITFSFKLD